MTDLRTRLALAICSGQTNGGCWCSNNMESQKNYCISTLRSTNSVLAVLSAPSDADVERVARGIDKQDFFTPWSSSKRALAAIRALVGEAGG